MSAPLYSPGAFSDRLDEMEDDPEAESLLNPFSSSYQDGPVEAPAREQAPWIPRHRRQAFLVVFAVAFATSAAVLTAPARRPGAAPPAGGEAMDAAPAADAPDDGVWPHRPEDVQTDAIASEPKIIDGGGLRAPAETPASPTETSLAVDFGKAADPHKAPAPADATSLAAAADDWAPLADEIVPPPDGGDDDAPSDAVADEIIPPPDGGDDDAPSDAADADADAPSDASDAADTANDEDRGVARDAPDSLPDREDAKRLKDGAPADRPEGGPTESSRAPKSAADVDAAQALRPDASAPPPGDAATQRCAADKDGSVACSYTASDFLAFANVRAFVDRVDGWDDLLELVPSRVDVSYDPALVAGSTGRGGGLVAFALYNGNGVDGTRSSFLVVAAQDGELVSVVSTTDKDRGEMSTHFDPVKVVDPDTLVTMSNDFMNEDGYAYVWSWKDDEDKTNVAGDHLRRLNDKIIFSSHDIQLEAGDDAYWQSTGAHLDCVGQCGTSFSLIDAATGGIRKGVEVDNCRDVNAVQVVAAADGAETAYVSCRLYNSVNAIDVATGATKWIAGGDYGTLDIVDQRGQTYARGASFWHGQHNPESFAEDGVFLFDNAYTGQGDDKDTVASQTSHFPSRVLGFKVDEDAETARIFFEYVFYDEFPYGYSEVFGDADLLPSTNVLTSWWPAIQSPSRNLLFDTELLEVTRDGKVAWSYKIYGNAERTCVAEDWETNDETLKGCAQGISSGWKVYAPEKFFGEPLAYGATLGDDGRLDFKSHAAFKSTRAMAASFVLEARGSTLSQGDFEWLPHWRQTRVSVSGVRAAAAGATLTVTDEWGQSTTVDVALGGAAAGAAAPPHAKGLAEDEEDEDEDDSEDEDEDTYSPTATKVPPYGPTSYSPTATKVPSYAPTS